MAYSEMNNSLYCTTYSCNELAAKYRLFIAFIK